MSACCSGWDMRERLCGWDRIRCAQTAPEWATGECRGERRCRVWDTRGIMKPDIAHTWCKTSDTCQVLLARGVQTAPKWDFNEVNLDLWSWSSHCGLYLAVRVQKGAISSHSFSSPQMGLCENIYKRKPALSSWLSAGGALRPIRQITALCSSVRQRRLTKKNTMCSSGLQVPVHCIEQPWFSSWEFFNTDSEEARIELNPL